MNKKRVLFLCTENSARSQMAEGLLRQLGADKFEASSAGLRATQVNPLAVKAMAEAGIDISCQKSKSIDAFKGENFDYIISVCSNAEEACPAFSSACRKIHWDLDDPAQTGGSYEERLASFRLIRDQIRDRLSCLLHSSEELEN